MNEKKAAAKLYSAEIVHKPVKTPASQRFKPGFGATITGSPEVSGVAGKLYQNENLYSRNGVDGLPLDKQERDELHRDLSDTWTDLGINPGEAGQVTALILRYLTKPATAEERAQWKKVSSAHLKARYGDSTDGAHRLSLAKQAIASSTLLSGLFSKTGLGDHPDVVQLFVDRAYALGARK
jgi:hypothetical protein